MTQKPFKRLTSQTLVLRQDNIDTDQIIPARFLTTTSSEGLGAAAFYDWRYKADGSPNLESPLNAPDAPTKKILVAMLAAARERLVTTGALVPPPRPQEAASASSACDPTVLRQQMDRHVMLQAMPSWEQIDERRGASGAGSSGRSALGKRRAGGLAAVTEQRD